MKIVLQGQIRGGKNNMGITRTGRHYPKKLFVEWRADMEAQVRAQVGYPGPYTKPLKAVFNYFPGDLRRRDVPAMLDAVFHVLERTGIVEDDSLIEDTTWMKHPLDRTRPRVIVELAESASRMEFQQSGS